MLPAVSAGKGEVPACLCMEQAPGVCLEPASTKMPQTRSAFPLGDLLYHTGSDPISCALKAVRLSVAQIKEPFYISCHVYQRLPFQCIQILLLFLWQTLFCLHLSTLLVWFLQVFFLLELPATSVTKQKPKRKSAFTCQLPCAYDLPLSITFH